MPRRATSRAVTPDPLLEEVRTVRDLVEETLGVLTYGLQDPEALDRREQVLRSVFGRGRKRAQVFLALDRDLNISQVAQKLDMKRENASSEIRKLHLAGLVMPMTTGGRGDVWIRNPLLERVHGLTAKVTAWLAAMESQTDG